MVNIFDNFKLINDSILLVDIGIYGMKVVEVKKRGKTIQCVNAFTVTEMAKYFNGFDIFNPNGIVEQFHQIIQLEKIKAKKIILSFSSSKMQKKIINVPDMPDKQVTTFAQLESQKFPNYNKLSDVVDFMPLGKYAKDNSSQEQISLLLACYPANEAARLIKEFQNKKYFVEAVDVDTHALGNIGRIATDDESDRVVFDIGQESSQLVFLREKTVIFNKSIPFGATSMVRALQGQEDISVVDAQKIIETHGMKTDRDIEYNGNTIFSDDYNETMERSMTNSLNEAYRSFQTVNNNFGLSITKVDLTGGVAMLNGIVDICRNILEVESDVWILEDDDYLSLNNGVKIINSTGRTLDSTYAICIGMALRGMVD